MKELICLFILSIYATHSKAGTKLSMDDSWGRIQSCDYQKKAGKRQQLLKDVNNITSILSDKHKRAVVSYPIYSQLEKDMVVLFAPMAPPLTRTMFGNVSACSAKLRIALLSHMSTKVPLQKRDWMSCLYALYPKGSREIKAAETLQTCMKKP